VNPPVATVLEVLESAVRVRVEGAPACPRCASGQGCGAGLLAGRRAERELTLERPAGLDLAPGDRVTLTLPGEKLLGASLLAYGLPLKALVVAPVAADRLWGPFGDASLAAIGAGALVAAIVAGRRLLARDRCLERLVPDVGPGDPAAARDA